MTNPAPTPPPPQPATPPARRRSLEGRERVILTVSVFGLIVAGTALLTLPPPDVRNDASTTMVAVLPTPPTPPSLATVTPSVRAPVAELALPSAAEAKPQPAPSAAIEKPIPKPSPKLLPKAAQKSPPKKIEKSVAKVVEKVAIVPPKPVRRRESLCELHVTAEAWHEAFASCTSEAQNGNAPAQRRLAMMYLDGRGTGRDEASAARWFTEAATAGDAESMYQLAVSYERGRGIKKDRDAALRFYSQAAEGDHAAAEYALGEAYERGKLGAPKNKNIAIEWYKKAAAQNFRDAADKVRGLLR